MTNLYDDYCAFTGTTAIYPQHVAAEYLTLGLCSEAAECVELIYAKPLLKCFEEIGGELGDCQYYVARLAHTYNLDFAQIVQWAKLAYHPSAYRIEDLLTKISVQAGLIAGKVKKQLRDGNTWNGEQREDARFYIQSRLIDIVEMSMHATDWLHAHHGSEYGHYDNLLIKNREKLQSRKERGVLRGDGSAR